MSVNHISSQHYLCGWKWNTQQQLLVQDNSRSLLFAHHLQNFNLNNNNNDDDDIDNNNNNQQMQQQQRRLEVKVIMFEKPLTPSDVGKLNRLVIPKQYAERYFPLNGADSSGMLLSFEDEVGKFWRFRYSYWNSSQSYVLTKGWSRYVKDKRLDAGDVVIFERHSTDPDRLFIAWRRRHDPPQIGATATASRSLYPEASSGVVINGGRTPSFNGSTSSRTLRLFGVNMECHQFESDQSEPVTPDGSSTSSPNSQQPQQTANYQLYSHFYPQPYYAMVQHKG